MTDMQLWLSIGIPTLSVLVGILLNMNGLNRVEKRLDGVEGRLVVVEGDLRRFYQFLGEHTGRLDSLEKRLDRL